MKQNLMVYNGVEVLFDTHTEKFLATLSEEQGGRTLEANSLTGIKKLINKNQEADPNNPKPVEQPKQKAFEIDYGRNGKHSFVSVELGAFGKPRSWSDTVEVWVTRGSSRTRRSLTDWHGTPEFFIDTPENRKLVTEFLEQEKEIEKQKDELDKKLDKLRKALPVPQPLIPRDQLPNWGR